MQAGTFGGASDSWNAPDGAVLPLRLAVPSVAPRFLLLALHGLGGEGCDFGPLVPRLLAAGGLVAAPDLRSQGHDPVASRRGDLRSARELPDDAIALAGRLRAAYPGIPLFMAGESLGGVIALHAAAQEPDLFDGLVLFAPVVGQKPPLSQVGLRLFDLLVRVVPRIRLSPEAFLSRADRSRPEVTRDRERLQYLRQADHRFQHATLRFYHRLGTLLGTVDALVPRVRTPMLVLGAGKDAFVAPELLEALVARAGTPQAKLRVWPEAHHLLLWDPVTPDVVATVEGWIRGRLAKDPAAAAGVP